MRQEVYRQKLEDKLTLDSEGRPFKMLVFRGSPKSSRKSIRHIDEMQRQEVEEWDYSTKQYQFRKLPNVIIFLFFSYFLLIPVWF